MSKKPSGTSEDGDSKNAEGDSSADETESSAKAKDSETAAPAAGAATGSAPGDAQDDADDSEAAPKPAAVAKADRSLKAARSREADEVVDDEEEVDEAPRKVHAGRTKSKRVRKQELPAVLSEEQIDSPSKQTLGMLAVVAAATLVMWGVGRAKCNYHDVGEGMKPRQVSLEDRTRTPKDLALAFQHALSGYDFATAAKLATGDAGRLVEQRKNACKPDCAAKQDSLKDKIGTVSELLQRTASYALARVWSEGGDSSGKYLAVLKRDTKGWKVDKYTPDDGRKVELPGESLPSVPEPGEGEQSAPGQPTHRGAAPLPPGSASASVPPLPRFPLHPRAAVPPTTPPSGSASQP